MASELLRFLKKTQVGDDGLVETVEARDHYTAHLSLETGEIPIEKSEFIKNDPQNGEKKCIYLEGTFEGTIAITSVSAVTIGGNFSGHLSVPEGTIVLSGGSQAHGSFSAKEIIILGSVNGNIHSSGKVEIGEGASVNGEILCQNFLLQEGVKEFDARVQLKDTSRREHD